MDVGTALRLILVNDAIVLSIVGNKGIHPNRLPEKVTYPAIAYQLLSRRFEYVLDGTLNVYDSTYRVVSVYQGFSKYKQAQSLDRAVHEAFEDINQGSEAGRLISDSSVSPPEHLFIQGIFPAGTFDNFDDAKETTEVISLFSIVTHEVD